MEVERGWDYYGMCKADEDYWNHMPLDKQMMILEKYYPIGMSVLYYSPGYVERKPIMVYDNTGPVLMKGSAVIVGYELKEPIFADKLTGDTTWYILKVKNDSCPFYPAHPKLMPLSALKKKEFEFVHPGFFIPNVKDIRDRKINTILEEQWEN